MAVRAAVGDDLDDVGGRPALHDDAGERGGDGIARRVGARRDHHGGLGALADADARIGIGVLPGGGDDHDGVVASGMGGNLDVARFGNARDDPVARLVAQAALDAVEDARQAVERGAVLGGHGDLEGDVVHAQVVPGLRGRGVDVGELHGLGHYPIAPSISSLMRLFISTAYSMGSSLEMGLAKPLTTIVRASASEQPRLMR